MLKFKTLLALLVFSAQFSAYASCLEVSPDYNLTCGGTFKAKSVVFNNKLSPFFI